MSPFPQHQPDPFAAEIRRQFVQNLIFFGGLIFAQRLFDPMDFLTVLVGYGTLTYLTVFVRGVSFSLAKGHTLPPSPAIDRLVHRGGSWPFVALFALFLAGNALFGGWYLLLVLLVLLFGLLHDLFFRTLVLYDVLSISIEFVLKAVAGAWMIRVEPTPWLLICTFLLALLLAVGQRRNEYHQLDETKRRAITAEYSPRLLDQMLTVAASSTLLAYSLYTIDADTIAKLGTEYLVYTLPVVLYGVLRYVYRVYTTDMTEGVEYQLLRDPALLGTVVLWAVAVIFLIYG